MSASQDGTVRIWDADITALNLDVPAEELLRIARSRSPRTFTDKEAQAYDVQPDPERQPTLLGAPQIQQLKK